MKKIIKWFSIGLLLIAVLLIIGIIALPYVFPLEKIKGYATSRLSETLNRSVKVERIAFNLFTGFKLEGLSISNHPGFSRLPFITADSIDLHYAFWPLFSRQIIIKEIALINPKVLIEKDRRGAFNFSDLLSSGKKPVPAPPRQSQALTKQPFDVFIDSFTIKNGLVAYNDRGAKLKTEIDSINLKISGFTLALFKPVSVQASATLLFQGKTIPLSFSTQVGVSPDKAELSLKPFSFSLAGESLSGTAHVTNWDRQPKVELCLATQKFSIDPLVAIFAPTQAISTKKTLLARGELTNTVNKSLAGIPKHLTLVCLLNLKNVTFQSFKLDKLDTTLSLTNKVLSADIKSLDFYGGRLRGQAEANLSTPGLSYSINNAKLIGFNASLFTNSLVETFFAKQPGSKDLKNKVFGILDLSLSLQGQGVESEDIFSTLSGSASLSLKNGELKRVKSLAAVGEMLKSNSLQGDIKFGSLTSTLSLSKKVLDVKKLFLDRSDFSVNFTGGLDLNNSIWLPGNRLTLKLSPLQSSGAPKELSVFRNHQGWLELTFELTGSLKLPLPKPIINKPIEAALEKLKVKIEAKKVELETQAQAELAKKQAEANQAIEAEKARLQEEAKTQIKNLLKF